MQQKGKVVSHIESYMIIMWAKIARNDVQGLPSCTALIIWAGVATPLRGRYCREKDSESESTEKG